MKGNKKMKRKGFTLIELLVVIAIIGLLSTLSVVSLNSAREKARDANRKSDMNSISTALELYNVEEDHYLPTAGICDDNILALTSALGSYICSSFKIENNGNEILHAIPTPPISGDYIGFSGANVADATSYCISAKLENGKIAEGYFKCVNGSCYLDSCACEDNTGEC